MSSPNKSKLEKKLLNEEEIAKQKIIPFDNSFKTADVTPNKNECPKILSNVENSSTKLNNDAYPSGEKILNFNEKINSRNLDIWYDATKIPNLSKQVKRKFTKIIIVCFIFICVELIGGILADSIAILADASHLLCDLAGFSLSLFAVHIAQRRPSDKMTFGFHRVEILGAITSVLMIIVLAGVLVYNATLRILNPPKDLNPDFMLYTSLFGLGCNVVIALILQVDEVKDPTEIIEESKKTSADHEKYNTKIADQTNNVNIEEISTKNDSISQGNSEKQCNESKSTNDKIELSRFNFTTDELSLEVSLEKKRKVDEKSKNGTITNASNISANESANVRATFIHILGDIIQSVGVVIASIIIKCQPTWIIVDPIITYVFALIVSCTTIGVLKDCIMVLLESVPEGVDIKEIKNGF